MFHTHLPLISCIISPHCCPETGKYHPTAQCTELYLKVQRAQDWPGVHQKLGNDITGIPGKPQRVVTTWPLSRQLLNDTMRAPARGFGMREGSGMQLLGEMWGTAYPLLCPSSGSHARQFLRSAWTSGFKHKQERHCTSQKEGIGVGKDLQDPSANTEVPCSSLNHAPSNTSMVLEHFQGWCLTHFPGHTNSSVLTASACTTHAAMPPTPFLTGNTSTSQQLSLTEG